MSTNFRFQHLNEHEKTKKAGLEEEEDGKRENSGKQQPNSWAGPRCRRGKLTYVLVADAAWHDPLISKVQGSKLAICPRAEVQRGSQRWRWRGGGAEGDIPTSCLRLRS